MASGGIWGIDIGQCGLKALRCELNDDGNGAVATAFDFIEYPMILSQPDADPEDLVREAFATFLSRNKIKGDRIAMSVSGQFGLTRFFGPPPCQIKQLPDLVRFEAKQTVPFPLEEVVWDWHRMAGGMEVEGFLMETQVGLFAMKREQVFKALAPFTRAGIELDIIQLAPVAIYNAITHDLLNDAPDEFDAENPPESLVLLSMGTDTTDLVITNGYRMWLRSIPVGGSHFTKQLVRELKLTFSKAEHTKRNARQAEDPKVIFQAMRPIFNDMVNEIQRSLMNFENNNRKAKLSKLVMLGNAIKLTGLTHHLSKNLGHDLYDLTSFKRLDTTAIESSPSFKENQLSFGVSYGLCLQGLGLAKVPTNLMPREIVTQRIIREKKPWTLAGVSALLLAWALSYFLVNDKWYTVHPSRAVAGTTWEEAGKAAENVSTTSRNHKSKDDEKVAQLKVLKALGDEVAGNNDRRLMWLELVSTLTYALPRTENVQPGVPPDPKVVPFTARKEIHVDFIESEYFKDLTMWFTPQIRDKYLEGKRYIEALEKGQAPPPAQPGADAAAAAPGVPGAPGVPPGAAPGVPPAAAAPGVPGADAAATEIKGPEKEGWVVELRGYHYYNGDPRTSGRTHVLNTLLRSLEKLQITLPGELVNGEPVTFTMQERGVLFPTLIMDDKIDLNYRIPNPLFDASLSGDGTGNAAGMAAGMAPGMGPGRGSGGGFGGGGLGGGGLGGGKAGGKGKDKDKAKDREEPESYEAPRYQFTIQFVWQPMPLTKRLQMKVEQLAKAKAERDAALAAGAGLPAQNPVPGVAAPAPGAAVPGAPVAPGPAAPVPGRTSPRRTRGARRTSSTWPCCPRSSRSRSSGPRSSGPRMTSDQ